MLGVRAYPVATAVLSADTSTLPNAYCADLSEQMRAILKDIKDAQLPLDGVYTGYLSSAAQATTAAQALKLATLSIVDPIMGDDGQLYPKLTPKWVDAMRALCKGATVITPNMTEVALLCGQPYQAVWQLDAIRKCCARLSSICKRGVLTSVRLEGEDDRLSTFVYDEGRIARIVSPQLKAHYPGSGDVFATVLMAKLVNNVPLTDATHFAAAFVHKAIEISQNLSVAPAEGLALEEMGSFCGQDPLGTTHQILLYH